MNSSVAPKKSGGIKEMDKRYFREIFGLHSKDDKINYEGLCKIFEMVDFKPNEKQEVEFKGMFAKKEEICFGGKSTSFWLTCVCLSRLPIDLQLEE